MNKRQLGTVYEQKAAAYLQQQGYEIMECNFRCRMGEIDIIAREGEYLCFVEVKYRSNSRHGSPESAVTSAKQRQISKVAVYYMKRYGYDPYNTPVRFDVIAVTENEIRHIKDAFPYQGYY